MGALPLDLTISALGGSKGYGGLEIFEVKGEKE
jgi:hypothetical protein